MYRLPETLAADIEALGVSARQFGAGQLEPAAFKMKRVPMGIYEQRRDGTYMVRIRTTGGVITPRQLKDIMRIAIAHGSDLLHITTRQEIQIQNVAINRVEDILKAVRETGLGTKGGGGNTVRNILVDVDSGIDRAEEFDPTPHAMALTSRLIAEDDSFTLPRKLKIAFASSEAKTGYAAVNDIGLVARKVGGKRGFKVYIGGSVASKPTVGLVFREFLPEEELFILAEAVKRFFNNHGNRKNRHKARIRHIFYNLGEEKTLALLDGYFIEARGTTPSYRQTEDEDTIRARYTQEEDLPQSRLFLAWKERYTRAQKQAGYYSVIVPIIHGNIPLSDPRFVESFTDLLDYVSYFGKDTVRFSTRQNIHLRNIPAAALNEIHSLADIFSNESSLPLLANNIVSCTGADTCRLGICLSKGLAKAIRTKIIEELPFAEGLDDIKINVSGCPNSCGQQVWADLGFSGKALRNDMVYPAYQVYAGASAGKDPELARILGTVNAREVPGLVVLLLEDYVVKKNKYGSFRNYLEDEGYRLIGIYIEKRKNIPSFEENIYYYYDWGADTQFSLTKRGVAECSAGIFDIIELEQKAIAAFRNQLPSTDGEVKSKLLYDIILSASRMLLVTRGAESRSDKEAFTLFRELFIDAGLVDGSFASLLENAHEGRFADYMPYEDEILRLAEAVNDLYGNMDDSLQFKHLPKGNITAYTPVETGVREEKEHRFKDLRGTPCPINFVQTKIVLAQMHADEVLEILLDDGQPIANVPGSVRNEGHEILDERREEDYWRVIIRKKSA